MFPACQSVLESYFRLQDVMWHMLLMTGAEFREDFGTPGHKTMANAVFYEIAVFLKTWFRVFCLLVGHVHCVSPWPDRLPRLWVGTCRPS